MTELEDLIFRGGGTAQMSETGEVKGNFYRTEVIAQLFGVSVRRIQQLTQEGIISTTEVIEDGRKQRRYDLVPTIQKYVKYLSDKAYGKQYRTEKEMELREQKMQADIALKESQGELHRLKTSIAAGDYISIEEVRLEPLEEKKKKKEISSEISSLLNSFVIAGIVEPKDAKGILKNGETQKTLEEEVPGN